MLVRKAMLSEGTDPAGMLHPHFHAPLPRGWWFSPHPRAPSANKLILGGWSSQLGSWMRLSPSHIMKAMKLLKRHSAICFHTNFYGGTLRE